MRYRVDSPSSSPRLFLPTYRGPLPQLKSTERIRLFTGLQTRANWSWRCVGDAVDIIGSQTPQTTKSHLVLIGILYSTATVPYDSAKAPRAPRLFLPGPGEGLALQNITLELEGVVRIDGGIIWFEHCIHNCRCSDLRSVSPRPGHILFSTSDPPAVQRIPWPKSEAEELEEPQTPLSPERTLSHETWALHMQELSWVLDAESGGSRRDIRYSFNVLFRCFGRQHDPLSSFRWRRLAHFRWPCLFCTTPRECQRIVILARCKLTMLPVNRLKFARDYLRSILWMLLVRTAACLGLRRG